MATQRWLAQRVQQDKKLMGRLGGKPRHGKGLAHEVSRLVPRILEDTDRRVDSDGRALRDWTEYAKQKCFQGVSSKETTNAHTSFVFRTLGGVPLF